MSFNSFGYNGVFELRKEIVDKLLAQVHDRNWVEEKGTVRNDEFVPVTLKAGDDQVKVYLKLGRPYTSFDPAATKDKTVNLYVPLALSIFIGKTKAGSGGGTAWTRQNLPFSDVVLGLEGMSLSKVTKKDGKVVMQPSLKALTGKQIKLYTPGKFSTEIKDATIDLALSPNPPKDGV